MIVRTLLNSKPREIITAEPSTTVEQAMDMLIEHNIGCLPVMEDNKLVGIISDKDIFRKVHETKGKYQALKVVDLMSTNLIVGVIDDEISYIAGIMNKNQIRHIPIFEDEKVVGMVSQRDIIKTQAHDAQIENRYLKLYTEGMGSRDKSADF